MKPIFALVIAALSGCAPLTPEQAAAMSKVQYRPYQMTFTPIGSTPSAYTQLQPPVEPQQHSVIAIWTGSQQMVTTVTGLSAWRCEYTINGQPMWRIFETVCPSSISVK